jgi:hypothetical protein
VAEKIASACARKDCERATVTRGGGFRSFQNDTQLLWGEITVGDKLLMLDGLFNCTFEAYIRYQGGQVAILGEERLYNRTTERLPDIFSQ